MPVNNNIALDQVIHEYSKLAESFQRSKTWNEMSEDELWEELCLCILSSNVPYELAKSAFSHLRDMRLLNPEWIVRTPDSVRQIACELAKQIYLPKKKDGSCRKYRFPNVRAKNIVTAAKMLYLAAPGLFWLLKNSNSERNLRDFLVESISGVGLKQASHFLRNIGYSNSLAIIDSHVIAFLKEAELVQQGTIKSVTPKIYMRMEQILQRLCNRLDLNLSVLDMAIWRYMRGR